MFYELNSNWPKICGLSEHQDSRLLFFFFHTYFEFMGNEKLNEIQLFTLLQGACHFQKGLTFFFGVMG